jgi:hypothetical protein
VASNAQALDQKLDCRPHAGQLATAVRHHQRGCHPARIPFWQYTDQPSVIELLPTDFFRQADHSQSGNGGIDQHDRLIGGHLRLRADPHHGAVAVLQLPHPGGGRNQQSGMRLQLLGRLRHSAAPQIVRSRHEDDLLDRQLALDQARVRQRREMAAHRDVVAFLHDVDKTIRDIQLHMQLGKSAGQPWQMLGQIKLCGRDGCGHPHRAAGLGNTAAHHRLGRFGFDQRCARVLVEVAPEFGQREAARSAVDQPCLQLAFQLRHPFADGRLWHGQRAGGGGETAVLDRRGKQDQVIEIEHARKVHQHGRWIHI